MLLQLQILKVKAAMTVALLELTFSTKHSLERFAITLEQDYPSVATETKILGKICGDKDFCGPC